MEHGIEKRHGEGRANETICMVHARISEKQCGVTKLSTLEGSIAAVKVALKRKVCSERFHETNRVRRHGVLRDG